MARDAGLFRSEAHLISSHAAPQDLMHRVFLKSRLILCLNVTKVLYATAGLRIYTHGEQLLQCFNIWQPIFTTWDGGYIHLRLCVCAQ